MRPSCEAILKLDVVKKRAHLVKEHPVSDGHAGLPQDESLDLL